jgi:hypothetical protein
METTSDKLVIDGELITRGTSLFLERTREVAWITEIQDHLVQVETLTDSFEIHEAQFVKKVFHGDVLVESQPADHRPFQ